MNFNLNQALEILTRTPSILNSMLANLSPNWSSKNEGKNTWSPFDIVGHLVHGEKTDWMPRAHIILNQKENIKFNEFDRFAQFENSKSKNLNELLAEFETLRKQNIGQLKSYQINDNQLKLKGEHPAFGLITLKQLLSTWVVHDLGHISQISRVMAKQYQIEVGPWIEYLSILKKDT